MDTTTVRRSKFFYTILYSLILCSIFCALACGDNKKSNKDVAYFYSEDNVAKDKKRINGYEYTVLYIPEVKTEKQNKIHLCLRIAPDTQLGYKNDVITQRVGSVNELHSRIEKLNFTISDNFYIECKTKEIFPLISHMENTYGLEKGRLIHFVFADSVLGKLSDKPDNEDLVIVWQDKIYSTGKNYFRIPYSKIKEIEE